MFFVYVLPGLLSEAELVGPFASPDNAVYWASKRLSPGTWHDVELTGTGKWDALHDV